MEGKRTVDDIKREVAEGKWRCIPLEQDAQEIIRDLANFYETHKPDENVPDLNELIKRAKRHLMVAYSHDVGSGAAKTDFSDAGSSQA